MSEKNNEVKGNNEWKERDIGALWKREGKGQRYLSGKLTVKGEQVDIVVFVNKFKEKENQPDFRVYYSKPRDEGGSAGQSSPSPETPSMDSDLPSMLQ